MKQILLVLVVMITAVHVNASANFDVFFETSDQFFSKTVYRGLVDYKIIAADPNMLDKLVDMIADMPVSEKSSEAVRKAFYLNAYNILVIKGIVDNYPTESPLEINGFFDEIKYTVAGKGMTLSDLENKVIRKEFEDARIHFALVCAARGCPALLSNAYMPATVDGMLERQAMTTINNNKFVDVRADGKSVSLSKIFEWYKDDYVVDGSADLIAYLNRFLQRKLPKDVAIEFMEYDWNLNENIRSGK